MEPRGVEPLSAVAAAASFLSSLARLLRAVPASRSRSPLTHHALRLSRLSGLGLTVSVWYWLRCDQDGRGDLCEVALDGVDAACSLGAHRLVWCVVVRIHLYPAGSGW